MLPWCTHTVAMDLSDSMLSENSEMSIEGIANGGWGSRASKFPQSAAYHLQGMTVDRGKGTLGACHEAASRKHPTSAKLSSDTMAPIWDETAQQQPGLPSVTVAPKHDESRRMKGVEWVRSDAAPASHLMLPSISTAII